MILVVFGVISVLKVAKKASVAFKIACGDAELVYRANIEEEFLLVMNEAGGVMLQM